MMKEAKATMTSRERILAALRRQPVGRIPWAPYIGDPHFTLMFPDYPSAADGPDAGIRRIEYEIEFAQRTGMDFVKFCCPPYYHTKRSRVKVTTTEKDGVKAVEYRTPVGRATSVESRCWAGGAQVYSKYLLSSPGDPFILSASCLLVRGTPTENLEAVTAVNHRHASAHRS
jgi:hypothetical protein